MIAPVKIDPRINAVRSDLADVSLRMQVEADRYVEPYIRQCVRGVVPLLVEPGEGAKKISEIRYGEVLDVFEERGDGFAWVQNRSDRYVGYIRSVNVLSDELTSFSNRINELSTYVYAEPDVRAAVMDRITLGAYVSVVGEVGGFNKLSSGGYIFSSHITTTENAKELDYVYTAGRLLNTPYLWGGRTPFGIDCSGLVQLVLDMADIECMRDVDEQREMFGSPLPVHWRDFKWKRGDLVFFHGHVGIMTDHEHVIHASTHAMKVTVEPLVELVLRGKEIIAMGRP